MIELIVGLVILGVVLYLINVYVPMDHKIKTVLNVVVVIVAVVWALTGLGLAPAV